MKYLYIHEDGALTAVEHESPEKISSDDLQSVDDCVLDILRFVDGSFQRLVVESEEVPEDEDDEDNEDTVTQYSISHWEPVS